MEAQPLEVFMTWAKWAAIALAFVGAVALGVLIGPRITHHDRTTNEMTTSAPTAAGDIDQAQPAPKRTRAARASAQPMKKAATVDTAGTPGGFPGARRAAEAASQQGR
jgi:hypothetical protein